VVPSFDADLRPAGGDRHFDGAASVQVRFACRSPLALMVDI
jgi:hypothetical protein